MRDAGCVTTSGLCSRGSDGCIIILPPVARTISDIEAAIDLSSFASHFHRVATLSLEDAFCFARKFRIFSSFFLLLILLGRFVLHFFFDRILKALVYSRISLVTFGILIRSVNPNPWEANPLLHLFWVIL